MTHVAGVHPQYMHRTVKITINNTEAIVLVVDSQSVAKRRNVKIKSPALYLQVTGTN